MIVTRLRWLAALGVSLSLSSLLSAQSPIVWRAAGTKPTAPATPVVQNDRPTTTPAASLGRPIPIAKPAVAARLGAPVFRAKSSDAGSSFDSPERPPAPPKADRSLGEMVPASAGAPEPGITIPLDDPNVGIAPPVPLPTKHVSEAPPDDIPPPPVAPFPPAGDIPVPGVITDQPVGPSFWDRCVDAVSFGDKGNAHGRTAFGSDCCFPGMISPVTMPFYFEDPRSLSEIRPIFSYQAIPTTTPYTPNGGNAMFFGTQGRLSITDRLSVVFNELGFLSINPSGTPVAPFSSETGFAELKLGPKWTFLRSQDTGTVGAVGLTFEIPAGAGGVFQNTGTLSLDPYLSLAQTVSLGSGWGSLNFMGTTGYSFSVDNARSEFYYLNFHVDYNIAGLNKIYPLFELNWIHYGNRPDSEPFNFEGAYLINFGATNRGSDWLSLAGGLRYRFTENVITGLAADFPVLGEKGFANYRILFDVIFQF